MFTHQLDRPRQRVGARPGDTGIHQRIEHLPFGLLQPRHHRYRDVSEQDSFRAGFGTDLDAPGHLAPVAILRLAQRRINPAYIIAWSLWRRAHQAAAQKAYIKSKSQL